jgi:hypothetical protein
MVHGPINGDNGGESGVDVEVFDTTNGVFILWITPDGGANIRARCSKEQALRWLTDITEAIREDKIGPGKGQVDL